MSNEIVFVLQILYHTIFFISPYLVQKFVLAAPTARKKNEWYFYAGISVFTCSNIALRNTKTQFVIGQFITDNCIKERI